MRFSVATLLAFAASALAQTKDFDSIHTPKANELYIAGNPLVITWDAPEKYASGTVSIELVGGDSQATQQHIAVIASGVKNCANTYTWTIEETLGEHKVYGLIIKLESDPTVFQYSNPFHIELCPNKSGHAKKPVPDPVVTPAPPANDEMPPPVVTQIAEYNMTVPCNKTGGYYPPSPTSSNGTKPFTPLPTSGAGMVAAGSFSLVAALAALFVL